MAVWEGFTKKVAFESRPEGSEEESLEDIWEKCISGDESESRSVMSNSLPSHDYTVHGILQARVQKWVSFPFSRVSSQPRDQTQVFCIAGGFFTSWAAREAQEYWSG